MSVTFVFYAIVVILSIDFLIGRTLSWLNIRNSRKPLPGLVADIYDADKYAKQQAYFRANAKLGWIMSLFSFVLVLCMYVFGGFVLVDTWSRMLVDNELAVSLVFFGILYYANDILTIPFQLYDTFSIEARFGFNRVTPRLFVTDKLKGWGLNLLIGGGLLCLIILIYQQIPDYFWIVAWAVVTVFGLFMSLFYSELIVPLFNKQTPLEAGELRDAIEQFARKTDFSVQNIYVMDSSKRSTKSNAYFTGWGKKKRIVLYDTLINDLETPEIVAVLAHEIGHNKHKHTLKSMSVSMPSSLLLFFLLGLILKYDVFAQAVGCASASFHINMLVFGILYTPVSVTLDLLSNYLSRKHEYQADAFVRRHGCAEQLVGALKKISAGSLSNLTPPPLYVFFYYSHPTLCQRISRLLQD